MVVFTGWYASSTLEANVVSFVCRNARFDGDAYSDFPGDDEM